MLNCQGFYVQGSRANTQSDILIAGGMMSSDATATTTKPKGTGFAIALAVILVVPGMFLGGLVVLVYMFFSNLGMPQDPTTSWIPFLGGILKVLWFYVVPEGIRGFVAMAAALWVTFFAFKQANREVVTYSVLAVHIALAVLLLLSNLFTVGFHGDTFGMMGLIAGFVGGAFYSET